MLETGLTNLIQRTPKRLHVTSIIIIIIIIIITISFMQCIYTYTRIPETNHAPKEQCWSYSVATVYGTHI
jgi:flagellar basal body-associated protein FliL